MFLIELPDEETEGKVVYSSLSSQQGQGGRLTNISLFYPSLVFGCPHSFLENMLDCQVAGQKTLFGSRVILANMTDLLECID